MAETNKSKMMSEAEIIEAINADTLVSVSLGEGQPQKNVKLSTLASVVAGVMNINKLYPFMPLGNVSVSEIDMLKGSGIYEVYDPTNTIDGWTAYGNIIVFNSGERFSVQIFVHGQGLIKFRTSVTRGAEWSDWIILNLPI